jgi:hypothetical protein
MEVHLPGFTFTSLKGEELWASEESAIDIPIRAAQTGVFDLDIRISNRPFIDVCKSFAAETGLESRNVEKRINACLSGPITALLIAVNSNNVQLARVLLNKGAEVNSGHTPLSRFEQHSRRTVDRKDEQTQPLKNCIFLYIFPYLLHLFYLLFPFGGVWHF